jgi:cytochrome c peroxidase
MGKFKTPSLRNLARSAPYMHDGRFGSLAAVIRHYRSGVRPSATLDPGLAEDPARPGIAMSDHDARQLEQFLRALSNPRALTTRASALPAASRNSAP